MTIKLKSRTRWVRRRYFGSAWYVKVKAGISAGELDIRHSGSIVSIRLVRDTIQEKANEHVDMDNSRSTSTSSAARPVMEHFRVGYD